MSSSTKRNAVVAGLDDNELTQNRLRDGRRRDNVILPKLCVFGDSDTYLGWDFVVEELALEAMEYDDQDEEDYLQIFSESPPSMGEEGSCKEWDSRV
ncbi:hypothetical protein Tco_1102439 [Tanacetum coccineum]